MALHVMVDITNGQIRIKIKRGGGEGSALSKAGPQLAAAYLHSKLSVTAFVRAKAPMVFQYELSQESAATITITMKVKGNMKSFTHRLHPTEGEVKESRLIPPDWIPEKPAVASLTVEAVNVDQNDKKPPNFFLYGACMGSCGSIGIDRISFKPGRVRATLKEKAAYSFHPLFDFQNGLAEFRLLDQTSTGETRMSIVNSQKINGIRRGGVVAKEWDGKNQKGKISKGRHQLSLKAWHPETKGGDWTLAWSRDRVSIE
jgi:hypothetical protein